MHTTIRSLAVLFFFFSLPVFAGAQECEKVDRTRLRAMLVELGYQVKDLETAPGKEKYEVIMTTPDLTVPVGYEISPSGNYIWLTVFLGKAPADTSLKNHALLRQNGKIQPTQFYITEKGNLMLGLAIENRGVTNAVLKRHSDNVKDKVSSTKGYWQ